jgi:hypothetical protein
MGHLTSDELVDLAEGTRADHSAPHLERCAACREQLADLRAALLAAAEAGEVPEPSPLFWEHLSSRIRDAASLAPKPRVQWWRPAAWPRLMLHAAASLVAAFVIGALLTSRGLTPRPSVPASPPSSTTAAAAMDPAEDDASLQLVSDLASQMDWEDVSGIGLSLHVGVADEAIAALSAGERRELQRLLQEK